MIGLRSCYRSLERCLERFSEGGDGLLWHMELKPHALGDYSIAVVQANSSLEDQSQVFTSPSVTLVGVYDGHGGPEASRFVNKNLFPYLNSEQNSPFQPVLTTLLSKHSYLLFLNLELPSLQMSIDFQMICGYTRRHSVFMREDFFSSCVTWKNL